MGVANGTLLTCSGVKLGYGALTVLEDVDLELVAGEYVGVVGPNGAGKTTLLKALTGVLPPLSGRIHVARRRDGQLPQFGYVAQSNTLDESYPVSVLDVVLMGCVWKVGPFRRYRPEDIAMAHRSLEAAGMAHLANRPYRELSRGQQQRVLLARALAGEPDILCLDEPTNFLDVRAQAAFMDTVQELRDREGMTILIVTHLLQSVTEHASQVWLVHDGRVRVLADRDEIRKELAQLVGGGDHARAKRWG